MSEALSRADRPLAKILMDGTLTDVILIEDTDRSPIGRAHLEIAFDAYSHMVTGYDISCTQSPD
jgi:hypothetical protein